MPVPIKILIVDDHPEFLRTVLSLLTGQGWQVFEAHDGKTAIERVQQINPEVVVLDIVMPVMNGLEIASEIRRLVPMPKLILISSVFSSDEAALFARLYGDGHFIPKTEIGRELIPAINRLLQEET